MAPPPFVHLRLRSEYSIRDSLLRLPQLLPRVARLGMPAVALTDFGNLYGMLKFYRESIAVGVQPIFGCDLLVRNGEQRQEPPSLANLVLLVRNAEGYRNLCQLVSKACREGLYRGQPTLAREWLSQASCAGLIALSGGSRGVLGPALLGRDEEQADKQLQQWMHCFPEAFYLELHRTGRVDEPLHLERALALAVRAGCPLVATNEVCFLEAAHYPDHELKVCIQQGQVREARKRSRDYSEQQYLRSPEEMHERFAELPVALQNTIEIARRCHFIPELGRTHLPRYPIADPEVTAGSHLRSLATEGLDRRLDQLEGEDQGSFDRDHYQRRLTEELQVIVDKNLEGYFLIVWDFVNWARDEDIPVGPGRGSGGGSLVAYAMGITDLDPIYHGLIFERFLNPERVSLPDFDIDFCVEGRDRVIEYVSERYGGASVAQVVTFGTMAARAVVRDVARALGKPYALGDKLARGIPAISDLATAAAGPLKEWLESDHEAAEVVSSARNLEGLIRQVGKHAGGVVIAPGKLTDHLPLYYDEREDKICTQFDKDDLEEVGLLKFDFLGLRTLTAIDRTLKAIRRTTGKASPVALNPAPWSRPDKDVLGMLGKGATMAVFQLESAGMRDMVVRLAPDCFEDLVALLALFRPGPLESGMSDEFIDRKRGRKPVTYLHDELKDILDSTYGVILYQEQVMQIARSLAGYSLGQADKLRRAMGKKKPEEMEAERDRFMKGAVDHGIPVPDAQKIFAQMETFAGYGFNKSHAACYALLSYHTAWLKKKYPAHFLAEEMSLALNDTPRLIKLIQECRRLQLKLLPPDINISDYGFAAEGPELRSIRFGLGAVKGLGRRPAALIVEQRQSSQGHFRDLYDCCGRLGQEVGKPVLEALICSGACDALAPDRDRGHLHAALDQALQCAEQLRRSQQEGIGDLFGDESLTAERLTADGSAGASTALTSAGWDGRERLQREHRVLGFYLSGHPLDEAWGLRRLDQYRDAPLARLEGIRPARGGLCKAVGMVVDVRRSRDQQGKEMAFLTLEDCSGQLDVVIMAELYGHHQRALQKERVFQVEGKWSTGAGRRRLRAQSLRELPLKPGAGETERNQNRALASAANGEKPSYPFKLVLELSAGAGADLPEKLLQLLKEHRRKHELECSSLVVIQPHHEEGGSRSWVELGEDWKVKCDDELYRKLHDLQGLSGVKPCYD